MIRRLLDAFRRLFRRRPEPQRLATYEEREERYSDIIAKMQQDRQWPRSINYLNLVARPTRDHYREVWRLEDQKLLDAEATRPRRRKR